MMNIPFSPPDITEEEINEVVDTLRSGWITTGPKTKRFEKEIAGFCHTKRAVCLNSATASLELCLRILGIGPGDEVDHYSLYLYSQLQCDLSCGSYAGAGRHLSRGLMIWIRKKSGKQ